MDEGKGVPNGMGAVLSASTPWHIETCDVLERALRDVPPSTVRGARCRLTRAGLVVLAGRCRDRRKKWRLA